MKEFIKELIGWLAIGLLFAIDIGGNRIWYKDIAAKKEKE